jgi:hypothetical protein
MWISIRNRWRESFTPKYDGTAMLNGMTYDDFNIRMLREFYTIDEFGEFIAFGKVSTGTPIENTKCTARSTVDRSKVSTEGYIRWLKVETRPQGFEGTATGVAVLGIIPEQGEMSGIATRRDAR